MADQNNPWLYIDLKAQADKEQIKQEASKVWDIAQKELDKQDLELEFKINKAHLESKLDELKKTLSNAKKTWDKELEYNTRINITDTKAKLKQLEDSFKDLWKTAEENAWEDWSKWVWKFMKWLKNTAIWGAVITAAVKLTKYIVDLWKAYNEAADKIDRFTWSSEQTKELLWELSNFAINNGLSINSVREMWTELLQMWMNAEQVVPTLQALWDVSAWTWTSMEDLIDIFRDIQEEWSLTEDTFNDLIKAWVPIWDQLAKDLWLTVDQVKALASEWKITEEQVSTAFQHMSEEWWMFFGSMAEWADSFSWKLESVKWKLQVIAENVAQAVMPAFEWLMEDAIKTADDLTEVWQTWESWMKKLQQAVYIVVQVFRGLIKVIQNVGAIFWTRVWAMYTVWMWFSKDVANTVSQLFSADAWSKLWDNIAYGISQWVNGAIDAINKLSELVSQIPWVSFWKIDHVSWWKKTEWWLFDFSNTSNALEGAKNAMKDTLNDIWDDWLNFFEDVWNWWENLWKTTEKTTKTTNATLNDLIKNSTNKSKAGSKDAAKTAVEAKKKELQDKRDLMIKEVEESEASENEKRQKLLDIYNWYKNELIVLEWKTNDELLKNAKDYLEDYQKEFEKASESDQKAVEDSIKKVQKYDEQIWKLWEKREEYKEKAKKSLREVNNSIDELDKDFIDDTSDRYDDLIEKKRELMSKNYGIEDYAKRYDKDTLYWFQENWMSKLWDIDIKNILEYQDIMREISFIESTFEWQLKTKIELTEKLTETEKKYQEYLEKRNQLVEQSKIYEAYAQQEELSEKAIKLEDDKISYYDKEQDKYVEITDFKNQEIARELLNQQTKLDTENQQLETAKKEELEIINNYNNKILARWQSDTKAYKTELNNRKEAVRQYVEDVQALLSSIPSSYRAYGWELNKWVTMVWENWPEAIVRRQASYVQPRNSVMNNSTVYNNQSSLSVNWIEIGNFASVEDMLNWLKPYLTRRS